MKIFSVTESDAELAKKYLRIAIASSIFVGLIAYFLLKENKATEVIFAVPVVFFFFSFFIHLFYKKRGLVNSIEITEKFFSYDIGGEKKVIEISEIKGIEVDKYWGSQSSRFIFYIRTDGERVRVPRLESVTDIKLVKLLTEINPKIESAEARKVFTF